MKHPHSTIFCEFPNSLSVTSTPSIHFHGLVVRHRFKPSKLGPVCMRYVPASNFGPNTDFVTSFFFVLFRPSGHMAGYCFQIISRPLPTTLSPGYNSRLYYLTASLNKYSQGDDFTGAPNAFATWISEGHLHFCATVLVSCYGRAVVRYHV